MIYDTDVLIIGGGVAGLIAGIHLAQSGLRVLLLEKHAYPHHKVCGEYISNEVLPYLAHLGMAVNDLNPTRIHRFLMSTVAGKTVGCDLPLGGFGVSRHRFDHFLAQQALSAGVNIRHSDVTNVQFKEDGFTVTTASEQTHTAKVVIGAYGKRALLDKRLRPTNDPAESAWLGVKAHYRADFPSDLVALHNFEGGYCGLSQVENGIVNACYLTNYRSFKTVRNIDVFQQQVLGKNPFLKDFFSGATRLFDKSLTISQISFVKKKPVANHVLMCGDTAGLIHPLCGNGMAMAIHSAKLVSELIIHYFTGKIANRLTLEKQYATAWSDAFQSRLATGRMVQSLLSYPTLTSVLLKSLPQTTRLLPLLIRQTHGKPLDA